MRLLLLLSAFLFSFAALAQEKKDSLQQKIKMKSDSLSHKVDSVNSKINNLKKSILPSIKLSVPDSLDPTRKIQGKTHALNEKVKSMTSVDSLFLFNPEMKKVDSLKLAYQARLDEIKNKTNRKKKQIKHSTDSLQLKYQTQVDAVTKRFMAKNKDLLAGHEQEIASKANFNVPAVSSQFPNINLNSPSLGNLSNISLPNASMPNVSLPTASIPNASIPNSSLPSTSLPKVSLPNANSLDIPAVKEIQKETTEVSNISKQAGEYQKQLKEIKKDSLANAQKLEKMIEDQAQGRKEIKALRAKELEAEKMKKLQQQYLDKVAEYKNPKKAEEEIKKNLANVANTDLLKNEKTVQSAQGQMAKAKKKYGEFQSIKNLPKRALNPMSQLPLRERIYPGIFFQTSNGKFFSLDLAPQVYYKITTRFDVGTGLVYRVNYDLKKSSTVENNNLYGFKAFANFKIYKTFYFRLEGERICKQQPTTVNPDLTFTRWTNTLLGGIGKEILISKKLQGNTLILYNALEKYDNPYASKVLFRIGFNLSLKKSQRKEFIRSLEAH